MLRESHKVYFDDCVEFHRDSDSAYYVCLRVNGNAELVCSGLEIDDGGNTPNDECNEIVSAACNAFEGVAGFNSTKVVTYFHHAREVGGKVSLCRADLAEGCVDGEQEWIERKELPAEAEAKLAKAEAAYDAAYAAAVESVERDHADRAVRWLRENLEDGDWDSLRYTVENGKSCLGEEIQQKLGAFLDLHDELCELAKPAENASE